MEYQGELAGEGTGILTLSVLKGIFGGSTEEPVSYVNAPQLAERRGLEVRESPRPPRRTTTSPDHAALGLTLGGRHADHRGLRTEPRIVMVDDHTVEVPPSPHMLVVRNDDRPGMIGVVGTVLGEAGVSISSMAVGPSPESSHRHDGHLHDHAGTRPRGGAAPGRRGDPRHPPRHALTDVRRACAGRRATYRGCR